jgi:hypothetical protein
MMGKTDSSELKMTSNRKWWAFSFSCKLKMTSNRKWWAFSFSCKYMLMRGSAGKNSISA